MENEKDLKKELLKQNGIEYGHLSEKDQNDISRLLARDKIRLKRMTLMVRIFWGIIAAAFVLVVVWKPHKYVSLGTVGVTPSIPAIAFIIFFDVLLFYTIFCTIRL